MTKIICKQCKKEFKVWPYLRNTAQFCNKKCHNQWMSENQIGKNHPLWKERISTICKQCGKGFKVNLSRKETAKFCCNRCRGIWFSENIPKENYSGWRRGKIKKKCEQCGNEYKIFPSNKKARFCSRECYCQWYSENKRGENHHNWKGGVTPLYQKIRNSKKYKKFIQTILKKANYTCQLSGQIGGELNVHHIKPFVQILEENNITTLEEAENCRELWNKNNVIVLSEEWHTGIKIDNPLAFHRLYGRVYFTEEDFYEWFNEFKRSA